MKSSLPKTLLHLLLVLALAPSLACTQDTDEPFSNPPAGQENNGFDGEGGGTWSSAAPITAGPRQEVSVVVLDREMIVLGGFDDALTIVPSGEAYDPATDTWRSIAPMPQRMHHANAGVIDDKIYVAGFLTGRGFIPDGRGFVYDPDTDTWDAIAPMPPGTERGASAPGVIDGKLYIAGGLRGSAVADTSVYDPQTDAWTELSPMPHGVDHATAATFDGKLYVFGGRFRNIERHVNHVQIYDPATDSWSLGTPMPTSRAGLASAVLGGRVHVLGGEGNPLHPSGVFSDNEAYDPSTDSWEIMRPMATRRHGTGAAALPDGRVCVPGGAPLIAFDATDIHECYTLP